MIRKIAKVSLALLLSTLPTCLMSQNQNSSIQGTVKDMSGAVVTGKAITLTNTDTDEQKTATTDAQGFYKFVDLSPSNYKVTAAVSGFASWEGLLTLRVSAAALVNIELKPASQTTQVEVTDVTPVIDQVSPTLSDVKSAVQIENSPYNVGSPLGLLNFSPGVVAGGFANSGNGYTRVNGIPGGSIDYQVDGQTMSSRFTNELQNDPQSTPSFQEIKTTTANGNAEFSRPGMVEMVTKSGTNSFHGQLFEYNNNTLLTAKSFEQAASAYTMGNNFGGNVGGPLSIPKLYNGRDRTFFFVDLEGDILNQASTTRFTVPTATMKGGDLSSLLDSSGNQINVYDPLTTTYNAATNTFVRQQFPGNVIPANRINPIAAKILADIPNPNLSADYWMSSNYQLPGTTIPTRNQIYTGKLDHVMGQSRISARYTYTKESSQSVPSYALLNSRILQNGGSNGAFTFTRVLSANAINVFRAGVQDYHNYGGPAPISPLPTTVLGLPTYPGTIAWPSFYFDGYGSDYANPTDANWTGIDRDNPKDSPNATITGGDDFTYDRGNHQLKVGFEVQHYQVNTFETGQPGGGYNYSGSFTGLQSASDVAQGVFDQGNPDTGSGLGDFLLGETDSVNLNLYPHFHTVQTEYAGYAQDTWRATDKLIISYGLRYNYWTPFADRSGQQSTMDLNTAGGVVVYQGSGAPRNIDPAVVAAFASAGLPLESAAQAGFPNSLWSMSKYNFDPRLGLAYNITSGTVIRGGWGMYHWAMPLVQYQQQTRKNSPFSYSYVIQPSFTDANAAELMFPIAPPAYSAPYYTTPQPLNQFMLGQPGLTLHTNALAISEGSGFNEAPWDSNFKAQTVQQWNLTVEHSFPSSLGARVSYVGNYSYHLPVNDPVNALVPRLLSPSGATNQQRRKYPNFATSSIDAMDELDWAGYSTNNGIQGQIQKVMGRNLTLQAFFTYSRTLGTSDGTADSYTALEAAPAALTNNAPLSQRLQRVYANDSAIPDKTFGLTTHYSLPFGKGQLLFNKAHGVLGGLVSGYNLTGFFYWRSGLFFAPYYSDRGSSYTLAPGKTGILAKSKRSAAEWFDPSINRADLGNPYNGETFIVRANPLDDDFLNNIPRNYMTGPGFNNLDLTLYKNTHLTERTNLYLAAQISNAYNHINWDLPNNQGVITGQVGTPRSIQVQARVSF